MADTIDITATATDDVGVGIVEFYLDGELLSVGDPTPPYSIAWNTTTVSSGAYTITAVARDIAGNQTTSTAVNVTVNNSVPPDDPSLVGQWTAPISLPIVSVNAMLFHTGDVLIWDGFEFGGNAWVWDSVTRSFDGGAKCKQSILLRSGYVSRRYRPWLSVGTTEPHLSELKRLIISIR